jgi:hypothetical protein
VPNLEQPIKSEEREKLEITKLTLETRKLQLEAIYIRRTFFAQIFNTTAITFLGLAILLYVQMPQINEMTATRNLNETVQLTTAVDALQKSTDDEYKLRTMQFLASQWPQHTFIAEIATSIKAVVERKNAVECASIDKRVVDLQTSKVALAVSMKQQEVIKSFMPTASSAISSLKNQMDTVDSEVKKARELRAEKKCS